MSLDSRTTEDLTAILRAGGSVRIRVNDSRPLEDIERLASAAHAGGAKLTLVGTVRPTGELIRIASAGPGAVAFE